RLPNIDTLVLLQDTGPENSGRRAQILNRMVSVADRYQVKVRLAYYPPYYSKYNPVERCWGVLANHRNGALPDTLEAIVGYAKSMTWKKQNPVVRLVTKSYQLGVSLSKQAMKDVARAQRRRSTA
ncbi:MAG: ISAzo13 family transposase, partial [Myxococcales bacterium]|nr:ISAzo13 family transposase [Myxococcales bacterium]